jgi:REP element-mobilizing transposase RayT
LDTHVETPRSGAFKKDSFLILRDIKSQNGLYQRDVSTEEPRLKADSLGAIIGQIKSVYTKRIRSKGFYDFGWQAGYYDPIIRDNKELDRIREYINGNPQKWDNDEENPEKLKPKYRCPLQAH